VEENERAALLPRLGHVNFPRVIALAGLTALLLAASPLLPPQAQLIAYGKRLSTKRIDAQLADEPLQVWLRKVLGRDAEMRWEVDDCGEGGDSEGPSPLCLTVEAAMRPHGRVVLEIAIGSSDSGIEGEPVLFYGSLEGLGPTEVLERDELHLLRSKVRTARKMDTDGAQLPDVPLDEDAWSRQIQAIPMTRLGGKPTDGSVAEWVAARAGSSAAVTWHVAGCGNHGPPVALTGTNDEWAFVVGSFDEPAVHVSITLRAGTCRKGPRGKPTLRSISVWDKRRGRIQDSSLDALAETLAEIRRR